MRISTCLEVLRRGALGETIEDISTSMHIGKATIAGLLTQAGYPDTEAITAYRAQYGQAGDRVVWVAADEITAYRGAIEVDPNLVHRATAELTWEQLRLLFTIAVSMLPKDTDPATALGWVDTGTKRGPKRKAAA